jgi:hypothetical protein
VGCDIHMQVEVRRDGGWRREPYRELPCDGYYCDNGVYSDETPNAKVRGTACYSCDGNGTKLRAFWDQRNYDVFAILADVRNGRGFAGVDTGDGFVPIDNPRGFPTDLSPEIAGYLGLRGDSDSEIYRRAAEASIGTGWVRRVGGERGEYVWWKHPQDFWLGDHSFTYVTVAELLAYDWTRTTSKRGWVGPDEYERFVADGRPQSWSGGVSGGDVEHVSNQEMERRIADGSARQGGTALIASYYTLVDWTVSYADVAEGFLDQLHKYVVPLGAPEDVRLVMGFDS